jgi:diguanylate cyclase (GGDEF)-like protein
MPKTSRVAAIAAVAFVGFVAWTIYSSSRGAAFRTVDYILLLLVTLPPLVFAVLAACSAQCRWRAACSALAVGLACRAIGHAIWTYYALTIGEVPFPTVADAANLMLPVCACLAMLLFFGETTGRMGGRILLDGLIVAGSLFLISWMAITSPIFASRADDRWELLVSLAYPVAYVVVLTIGAVMLVLAAGDQRVILTLLTIGMACMALARSAFAYLAEDRENPIGTWVAIGWAAGLFLIAIAGAKAAESPREPSIGPEVSGWTPVWVPYVPLLIAAVVATAAGLPRALHSEPVVVIVILLVVAVLVRRFLAISDNRQLLAEVAEQAMRDPLTGLGNRALFNERLAHALQLRERGELSVGLIVLDLNDFKLVNDRHGHSAGDCLLRDTAARILGAVRCGDTVVRLGGDEFAVLVQDQLDHSNMLAHRVMSAFDRPFLIAGQEVMVHPSVGLAVADVDEPAVSAEELLRRVDLAVHSAKKTRIGGVHPFTSDMHLDDDEDGPGQGFVTLEGRSSSVQMLGELRRAIDQFELVLYYQPKVDLHTSMIVGVEALVRWPHPEQGILGPQDFLYLVRRHGMMWPMTELVVNKALDDAARWQSAAIDVPIAVNLFAPLLADLSLPAKIAAGLADRGLDAKSLTVELTEDLLLGNLDRTREVMNQLRQNGSRIAIDDFGQAYSAFSYLRDLPVDEVKLDYGFIATIATDRRAAVVAQSVLDMSHKLGMTTVAEGVENVETMELVRKFGCDFAQGYYYSPPLTSESMVALLKSSPRGIARSSTPL